MSTEAAVPAAPDTSDADLYAAAAAADAGQPVPDLAPSAPAAEPAPESSPAADVNAQPTRKTADERAAEETAEATAQGKPAAPKPDAKPETPYAKAQKEAERRDRSWKALEAEKAEIRAKQAEYERATRELAELKARQNQPVSPPKPAVDEAGIDASTYDGLAKKYAEEGNDHMAELARESAARLRQQERPAQAPAAVDNSPPHTRPEFQAKWREHTAALVQAEPDLAKPDHPVVQAANALLTDSNWSRFFLAHPDGIAAAVQVAKLQQQAAQAATAAKELATAKQEIARLTKLTSPRGSHPASAAPSDRNPADLSDADVRALADAADRGELGG